MERLKAKLKSRYEAACLECKKIGYPPTGFLGMINSKEDIVAVTRRLIHQKGGASGYAIYEEDVTGSLEVGKSADLVVIDQDLLAIDPLDISDTRVLRTYFQGRLVYAE